MFLDLQVGDVISDGKIKGVFEGIQVEHSFNINDSNISGSEYSIINSRNMNGTTMDVYIDHNRIGSISGSFKPNETYDIYLNGLIAKSIYINDDIKRGNSYFIYSGDHIIELKVSNNISTSKRFLPNKFGPFLVFNFE